MKKLFLILVMLVAVNASGQWVQCNNELFFSVLASNGNNIFAGTMDNGIFISSNNGTNWQQTSFSNQTVGSFAILNNNVFAGTYNSLQSYNTVYLSTNNGTNWNQTALGNKLVHCLAVSGNSIFAGTAGIYVTTNNGNSWQLNSLENQAVYSIVVNGNYIFAGTYTNGIFRSTDNGSTWTQTAMNNKSIPSLALIGNNIIAGAWTYYPYNEGGVYISTNYGDSWTQIGLSNKSVNSLITNGNNIFVCTNQYGIFLSTNAGNNWISKNQGLPANPTIPFIFIANNYIFTKINGAYGLLRRSLSEIIGIQNISTETPSKYSLGQNYPNPFNPTTNVKFSIVNSGEVKLIVYDVMGREVQTLVNERLQPGTYETSFNGSALNSGVYFYKLITDGFSETKKMLMIK